MKAYQLALTVAHSDNSRSAQWSYAAWSHQTERDQSNTQLFLILLAVEMGKSQFQTIEDQLQVHFKIKC